MKHMYLRCTQWQPSAASLRMCPGRLCVTSLNGTLAALKADGEKIRYALDDCISRASSSESRARIAGGAPTSARDTKPSASADVTFRGEPMRMMHMFVCCHVYLEYHLNISEFSGRATTCSGGISGTNSPLAGPCPVLTA